MELTSRTTATHRCPYCHDMLEDGAALVTCEGCETQHHEACAAELGRCSILGCSSLVAVPRREPGEGSETLEIRRRVRERVERFARGHAQAPVSPRTTTPAERLRHEIICAQEAQLRHDPLPLAHARREIEALEASMPFTDRQQVWADLGLVRSEFLDNAQSRINPKAFREEWVREGEVVLRLIGVAIFTVALATLIALIASHLVTSP